MQQRQDRHQRMHPLKESWGPDSYLGRSGYQVLGLLRVLPHSFHDQSRARNECLLVGDSPKTIPGQVQQLQTECALCKNW